MYISTRKPNMGIAADYYTFKHSPCFFLAANESCVWYLFVITRKSPRRVFESIVVPQATPTSVKPCITYMYAF